MFGEKIAMSAKESKAAFSGTESFFKEVGEANDEGKAAANAAAVLTSEEEAVVLDVGCCSWRRRKDDDDEFKDRCPFPGVPSSAERGLLFVDVLLEFRELDSALLLLEICSSKSDTLLLTPLSDALIVSVSA